VVCKYALDWNWINVLGHINYLLISCKEGEESPLYFTQIVEGARHPHYDDRHYDFKLSAWHRMGGEWQFHIQSVPTSEEQKDTEKSLYFPFWALPWLRQQMIEMLEEHDGSEQIGEMPTIPKWATRGFQNSNYYFFS
jgi:hypothetical protein